LHLIAAYLVSCGVLAPDDDNFLSLLGGHDHVDSARRVLAFAGDMQAAARTVVMPNTGDPVCIRIGIHTGKLVGGGVSALEILVVDQEGRIFGERVGRSGMAKMATAAPVCCSCFPLL
jgi:class 3 adenylate cyclase